MSASMERFAAAMEEAIYEDSMSMSRVAAAVAEAAHEAPAPATPANAGQQNRSEYDPARTLAV